MLEKRGTLKALNTEKKRALNTQAYFVESRDFFASYVLYILMKLHI